MKDQASGAAAGAGMSRRHFLTDTARTAGGVALFAAGLWGHAEATADLPADALRPPGARPEAEFLGRCIRCGLCVRYCPYNTLKLARFGEGVTTGTPWFKAREVPCEMCDDIPCVPVCPTGALDHGLKDIGQARMGLAVLSDHETCLNFQGLRCDICYRVCPVLDKAITLEQSANVRTGKHALFIPVVHSAHCTGCGKCEKACPLPEAAIRVLPIALVKGRLGEHYRLGWVEKEKAGHSLIPDQITLPVRGMEEGVSPPPGFPGGLPKGPFPGGETPGQAPYQPSGRNP